MFIYKNIDYDYMSDVVYTATKDTCGELESGGKKRLFSAPIFSSLSGYEIDTPLNVEKYGEKGFFIFIWILLS